MGDIIRDQIIPLVFTIGASLLTWLIGLALRKFIKNIPQEVIRDFSVAVEGFALRAKNKYEADLLAAKQPDSDGGVTITPKEISEFRQNLHNLFISELKGPVKDYALSLGGEIVKGFISKYLTAKVVVDTPAPTTVSPSQPGS